MEGRAWYLLTNYDCTYNHARARKGLISGLEVQLKLVHKYHDLPSRALDVACVWGERPLDRGGRTLQRRP